MSDFLAERSLAESELNGEDFGRDETLQRVLAKTPEMIELIEAWTAYHEDKVGGLGLRVICDKCNLKNGDYGARKRKREEANSSDENAETDESAE